MNNPYIDYGSEKINKSTRYIKRSLEKSLKDRIYNAGLYASVVGINKIGKTALVNNVLQNLDDSIQITINVPSISEHNPKAFFDHIIERLYSKVRRYKNDEILEAYNEYFDSDFDKLGKARFSNFCETLFREIGKNVFIVLDKFDAIENLFRNDKSYFEVLRDINDYGVVLIFVSKKSVMAIEEKLTGNSSLFGITESFEVKPYNNDELENYFKLLNNYINIDDKIKEFYKKHTGFHPYLLDILSKKIVKMSINNQVINLKTIYNESKTEINNQYSRIKKFFEGINLSDELLKIAAKRDVNVPEFINYGILTNNKEFFCEGFREYLLKTANRRKYQVAISCTGEYEDEIYAKKLIAYFKEFGISYFYYKEKQADMVGSNLEQYTEDVYAYYSDFCVVLLSKNYMKKKWTQRELEWATKRAENQDKEYIIPIKLDDIELENSNIVYLDTKFDGIENVAKRIKDKIDKL